MKTVAGKRWQRSAHSHTAEAFRITSATCYWGKLPALKQPACAPLWRSAECWPHTPAPDRAALLTVCTWLSWAMGNSTHATFYVDLAQKADPSLSMAHLLAKVLNAGMLPEWAFTA